MTDLTAPGARLSEITPAGRLTTALEANSADVLGFLRRRVAPEDAADLLGETMLTAWQKVAELPEEGERARMWLFVIARNHLLNRHRTEQRRLAFADELRGILASASGGSATGSATAWSTAAQNSAHHAAPHSAEREEERADVRRAIEQLDPELAEIVRLVHWDGFSLVEVGELLGTPASTIRGRYQRARETLRTMLGAAD